MSLSQATLDAITAAVKAALAEASPKATVAKAAVKPLPLSERREQHVGGYCEIHEQPFATAKGRKWHMEHIAH